MEHIPSRKHEQGYGLADLMLTLAVIGVMVGIAGTIFFSQKTFVQSDGLAKIDLNIAKALDDIYLGLDFAGITTQKVIDLQVVPTSMVWDVGGTKSYVDAYKGAVTIGSQSVNGGVDNGLAFHHPLIPTGDCALVGAELGKYFGEVTIGNVIVKNVAQELDVTKLATQCDITASIISIKAVYVP